ncbi:thioredoxin reductase [Streptosporangium becharense]|uniref:Thioredoxin reductase n=1 Tax=Streptosporangium becharense TaxID=1816182 RepID=A0A7W9ICR3_9ACTN|nr:NAD(P)/FAD-dependent oxidoreductase [Streptosporangium becharense]MBB2913667.1 thioredoxin reductase [Streptosporangium becharense]MBB5817748.1 thioredoxin reductase [Streptosporangium becharense]
MRHYDAVIIGGGPAGLTAALVLSRSLRHVLVVEDPRPPRNAASAGVHGIVGLDGVSPGEYRRRAWADLARYGMAERREAVATDVVATGEGGFTVTADDGGEPVRARQVLLATGVVDVHPDVEGFAECWGKTVVHCPLCAGWENRDRTWGVVTCDPEFAREAATGFSAWSRDVVVLFDGTAPEKCGEAEMFASRVRRLRHTDGHLYAVELADGTVIDRQTLFWQPDQRPVPLVSRLAERLGLAVGEDGYVKADASGRTSVPGLYAAGDLTTQEQGAIESAAAGSAAAFQMISEMPAV